MLVLSGLVVPIARGDAWDEVLRRTAHTFRGIPLAHPHRRPLLVTHGPSEHRSRPGVLAASRQAACRLGKGAAWRPGEVASSGMVDQTLSEQGREAVLKAIIKSAPTVGNSPTGVRDLAEAYALLERDLVPNAGVVQTRT